MLKLLDNNEVIAINDVIRCYESLSISAPSEAQTALIERAEQQGLVQIIAQWIVQWTNLGVQRFRIANGFEAEPEGFAVKLAQTEYDIISNRYMFNTEIGSSEETKLATRIDELNTFLNQSKPLHKDITLEQAKNELGVLEEALSNDEYHHNDAANLDKRVCELRTQIKELS
ncbi:hypothetical protein [Photobacterium leiognathi]|uniref:hypothetical protein n=1 Tax=Photobacterium leiognathi TaxID=553611 RepID=UPI002981E3BD|nr:hypothetical protein [Photobacterium leiognathi]